MLSLISGLDYTWKKSRSYNSIKTGLRNKDINTFS